MKKIVLLTSEDAWLAESLPGALPGPHFELVRTDASVEAAEQCTGLSATAAILELEASGGGAWEAAEWQLEVNPLLPLALFARRTQRPELGRPVADGIVHEKPHQPSNLQRLSAELLASYFKNANANAT